MRQGALPVTVARPLSVKLDSRLRGNDVGGLARRCPNHDVIPAKAGIQFRPRALPMVRGSALASHLTMRSWNFHRRAPPAHIGRHAEWLG